MVTLSTERRCSQNLIKTKKSAQAIRRSHIDKTKSIRVYLTLTGLLELEAIVMFPLLNKQMEYNTIELSELADSTHRYLHFAGRERKMVYLDFSPLPCPILLRSRIELKTID